MSIVLKAIGEIVCGVTPVAVIGYWLNWKSETVVSLTPSSLLTEIIIVKGVSVLCSLRSLLVAEMKGSVSHRIWVAEMS